MEQRLKQLRIALGYTQEGFAEIFEVEKMTVYKWEKGATVPNAKHLEIMANRFNADINWILMGINQMFRDKNAEAYILKLKSDLAFFQRMMGSMMNDTLARYSPTDLGIDPLKMTIFEQKDGIIHKTEIIEGIPPEVIALTTSKAS